MVAPFREWGQGAPPQAGRWLALLLWLPASVAAQDLRPPEVEFLPEVALPPDLPGPDGGVLEGQIRIERDGTAELLASELTEPYRSLLEAALSEARFRPATRGGEPLTSEVRVRIRVAEPERADEPDSVAPEDPGAETLEFGATARVRRPPRAGARFELAEVREIPGAFGDPFRILDTLPGTVPAQNGLPYSLFAGRRRPARAIATTGFAFLACIICLVAPATFTRP
ncbi:MAG: hypothetical protein AAGF12_05650 [Myxococcota bacterium]